MFAALCNALDPLMSRTSNASIRHAVISLEKEKEFYISNVVHGHLLKLFILCYCVFFGICYILFTIIFCILTSIF